MSGTAAPLKLRLGCGKRYIPGFVHVDLDDFPYIDHRSRIDRLPMFADGSAELIYCCHAFEYFDRVEGLDVLREWRRVLTPEGILRLAVPDFEVLAALYGEGHDLAAILGPLFGRLVVRATAGDLTMYHRTTYDYPSLSAMCTTAGFRTVRRYDWRQTEHADHDDFSQAYVPHMAKQHGRLISLNVEAVR